MHHKFTSPFLAFAAFLTTLPFNQANAQIKTADVVGVVTDASDAALPGANVTITNTGTNISKSVNSDSQGNYLFTLLPVGTYSVEVKKPGFQTAEIPSVSLAVGDRLKLDMKLKVGRTTETVQVNAQSPALQTQTSELSTLIDSKAVADLPVNNRNFSTLVQLAPGANYDTEDCCSEGSGPDDRRTPSNVTIDEQDPDMNNYQIDGMDNNERFTGTLVVKQSMDAIQEVEVGSNLYSAELGRTGGAVINIITKSGTNKLHGTMYEYFRNTIFDAANWLTAQVAPYRQNQFGGSVGGPIVKDRTFFFGDYEGYRNAQPTTVLSSVPTDAMRNGDFSDLLLPENYIRGFPTRITDPIFRTPYPGNVIPQNGTATETGWDLVGHNVLELYPLATKADRHLVTNNYSRTASRTLKFNTFDVKVNHSFSNRDSLFARYSFADVHAYVPPAIPIGDGYIFAGPGAQRTQGVQINYDHTWNPAWVANLGVGYSRYIVDSLSTNTGKNLSDQVGLTGSNYSYLSSGLAAFWPIGSQWIGDDIYVPDVNANNIYQGAGSVTHTIGSHTVKFGGELRRRQVFQNQSPYSRGWFYFFPFQTGFSLASLLTGYPFPYVGGRLTEINTPDYRFNEGSLFVQDDWRARRWLTLNLGLRYDHYSPIESAGMISNFDLKTGKVLIAGENGVSDAAGVRGNWLDFAPRFGFAASTSKTVLRGGFGISYIPLPMLTPGAFRNAPFISSWVPTQYSGPGPWRLEDGMPAAVTPEDPNAPTGPQNDTAFPYNATPYIEQFNLTLERQLPAQLVASVSYVGELGRHLAGENYSMNVNSPGNGQSRYPLQVNGVAPNVTQVSWMAGIFKSSYGAMQATVARRFFAGLGITANDTWEHGYDNFTQQPLTRPDGSVDEFHFVRGNTHLDVRNLFSLTTNYQLPFAKKATGVNGILAKGWEADLVVRAQTGFPFNVVNSSGTVAIPIGGGVDVPNEISDPFKAGPVAANPNAACHSTVSQGGIAPDKVRVISGPAGTAWFNQCAFTQQASGTWGDAGIESLHGPGYEDFDFGMSKTFPLTERMHLQFTAQAFNLFNHPTFGFPGSGLGAGGFGQISGMSSVYEPRNLQFALRLTF